MRTYKSIITLLVAVALLFAFVYSSGAQGPSQADKNRELILNYARAELERDYDSFDDLLTDDFSRHGSSLAAVSIF